MNPVFSLSVKALVTALLLMISAATHAYSLYKQSDIEQMIIDEANRQGVSPSLALAIARVESNFDPYALSHVGAKGVMQIMPATAEGEFSVSASRLYDPRVNISLGVQFIKQLINTYGGRVDIALSHYNGGSAVRDKYNNYRIIPATRPYVNKVLTYQKDYLAAGFDDEMYDNKAYGERKPAVALDDFPIKRKTTTVARVSRYDVQDDADYAVSSDPRVAKLQKLRVHNLTRGSASGQTKTYSAPQVQPAYFRLSKEAKVAKWESVYQ